MQKTLLIAFISSSLLFGCSSSKVKKSNSAQLQTIDLKAYEADMRHLIDTYIEALEPVPISAFGEVGLLDLIVKSGIADAINSLPKGIQNNPIHRQGIPDTLPEYCHQNHDGYAQTYRLHLRKEVGRFCHKGTCFQF
jgi:hypothetical protein